MQARLKQGADRGGANEACTCTTSGFFLLVDQSATIGDGIPVANRQQIPQAVTQFGETPVTRRHVSGLMGPGAQTVRRTCIIHLNYCGEREGGAWPGPGPLQNLNMHALHAAALVTLQSQGVTPTTHRNSLVVILDCRIRPSTQRKAKMRPREE